MSLFQDRSGIRSEPFEFLTFNGEVKATEPVSRQGIGSALENHSAGLVHLHHLGHDLHKWQQQSDDSLYEGRPDLRKKKTKHTFSKSQSTYRFEDGFIRFIINPIPQWVIHSIVLALPSPDVLQRTQNMSNCCLTRTLWLFSEKNIPKLTLRSPVPGKYSPYLWKETVMTRSVV